MPTIVLIFMIIVFGCLVGVLIYSFKTSTEVKEENDPQLEDIEKLYIFSIGIQEKRKFSDFMAARKFAEENPYLLCRRSSEFKWQPAWYVFNLKDCYVFKHPKGNRIDGYFYGDDAKAFALKHPYYKIAWVEFIQQENQELKWYKPGVFFNIPY